MITDKIGIKLFADGPSFPTGASFIGVFHDWIRRKELPELMIDVADYGHVALGTHVYFCGHESDYIIDTGGGRPGLLYRRRRAPASSDVLADGLARLFGVAERLEKEAKLPGLAFSRREVWVGLYDRLRAPNAAATFEALEASAREPLEKRLGGKLRFERGSADPAELVSVRALV